MTEKNEKPKSTPSNLISLVRFISRTKRKLTVWWINYDGNRVSYGNLEYNQELSINTFPTHPWIFRDQETNDELVGNSNHSIYWPVVWDGERDEDVVFIGIPVYTLQERCMQIVRKLYSNERIKKLSLPYTLIQELTKAQNTTNDQVLVNI